MNATPSYSSSLYQCAWCANDDESIHSVVCRECFKGGNEKPNFKLKPSYKGFMNIPDRELPKSEPGPSGSENKQIIKEENGTMEIILKIDCPELVGAINNLATAITGAGQPQWVTNLDNAIQQGAVIPFNAGQSMPDPSVPVQPPVGVPTTVPQPQGYQPHAQPPMPTAAPTAYTMEQLAVAATQLTDAGRRQDIVNLLAKYGVQALTQLPKDMYGAFATDLRQMGARI